jgi:hypothetical protein
MQSALHSINNVLAINLERKQILRPTFVQTRSNRFPLSNHLGDSVKLRLSWVGEPPSASWSFAGFISLEIYFPFDVAAAPRIRVPMQWAAGATNARPPQLVFARVAKAKQLHRHVFFGKRFDDFVWRQE